MPNMPRRDDTPASVLRRATDILDAFDADHPRLTLTELARRSGLPTSTAYRMVAELAEWNALVRDDDRRYRLGPRLVELALLAGAAALLNTGRSARDGDIQVEPLPGGPRRFGTDGLLATSAQASPISPDRPARRPQRPCPTTGCPPGSAA